MSNSVKKQKVWIQIRNPCNQFIVKHLNNIKQQARKNKNDRKFFVYHAAMQSVKRYPLPIICKQQLRDLAGIGDIISEQLVGILKDYYKKNLNLSTSNIKKQSFNDHQFKSTKKQVSQYSNSKQKNIDQKSVSSNLSASSDCDSKTQQKTSIIKKKRKNLVSVNQDGQTKSLIMRSYKPKTSSPAGLILIALAKMSQHNIFFAKKQITSWIETNQQVFSLKDWKILTQLLKADYIIISDQNKDQIRLTQNGRNYAQALLNKFTHSKSQLKTVDKVRQFKDMSEIVINQNDTKQQSKPLIKQLIKYQQKDTSDLLKMIIDGRQIKDQVQRDFFEEKLLKKHEINCKTQNSSIGDFIWLYDGLVLDYVIQRKKADDLASSIWDGRYKEQKYRLSSSGVQNIFYLYEGYPSQNSVKPQKQLNNALLKTRVYQKFKIIRTKDINQSIKFLVFMHNQLQNKIRKKQPMYILGTLQQFNKRNSKCSSLTIQTIFGMGLKCFPNVGKGSVAVITKYFKSFKMLFQKLKSISNVQERVQFLNQLLKGQRVSKNLALQIVQFYFNQSYQGQNIQNQQ